jgi:hypothetical protein
MGLAGLDDPAAVHDDRVVSDLLHDGQVVGDERVHARSCARRSREASKESGLARHLDKK